MTNFSEKTEFILESFQKDRGETPAVSEEYNEVKALLKDVVRYKIMNEANNDYDGPYIVPIDQNLDTTLRPHKIPRRATDPTDVSQLIGSLRQGEVVQSGPYKGLGRGALQRVLNMQRSEDEETRKKGEEYGKERELDPSVEAVRRAGESDYFKVTKEGEVDPQKAAIAKEVGLAAATALIPGGLVAKGIGKLGAKLLAKPGISRASTLLGKAAEAYGKPTTTEFIKGAVKSPIGKVTKYALQHPVKSTGIVAAASEIPPVLSGGKIDPLGYMTDTEPIIKQVGEIAGKGDLSALSKVGPRLWAASTPTSIGLITKGINYIPGASDYLMSSAAEQAGVSPEEVKSGRGMAELEKRAVDAARELTGVQRSEPTPKKPEEFMSYEEFKRRWLEEIPDANIDELKRSWERQSGKKLEEQTNSDDPYDITNLPPKKDEDKKPSTGEETGLFFGDIISKVSDYLEPMKDYYEKLRKKAEDEAKNLNIVRQELSGPDATKNLTSAIASSLSPLSAGVLSLVQKGKEEGFISNFIAKTQRELAGTKIPPSPKANIGKPAGLKPRKYTKGFYG